MLRFCWELRLYPPTEPGQFTFNLTADVLEKARMLFVGENKVKPVCELREFQQKYGVGM